jgi:hypothetical protein
VGNKWVGKQRLLTATSDQTMSRSQNVELISVFLSVRQWLNFLGLRTVDRA